MPRFITKFLLSSLAFLVIFLSFAPNLMTASAATGDPVSTGTWYNSSFPDWSKKVNDSSNPSEIFGERYTAAQVQWVIYGLLNFLVTTTVSSDVLSCVFSNVKDVTTCKSAIQEMITPAGDQKTVNVTKPETLIGAVFSTNRPLSGIGYVKEKLNGFSLVPTAHAQTVGFGFDALKPIQGMWKASRDLAYGLFVLTSIIFAFMIMFRVKINPQTVISVQSSIPKVIGALILVTFSYAIAGFLVDLMYVVIGFMSVFLSSFMPSVFGIKTPATAVFSLLTQGNILGVAGLNIQTGIFSLIFAYLAPLILTFLILTLLIGSATAGLLMWIPLILLVIIIIIGLWMSIKTVWALLKAFVNIILLTVFGPLQLALGVLIPNFGFGSWVKSFASNLSVFVVTGVLYFFSIIFLAQGVYIGLKDIGGDLFAIIFGGPFGTIIGSTGLASNIAANYNTFPPLLGSSNPQSVGLLFLGVSFFMFTLIPKATEIVQGFISGKPFAYGTAIGEAFAPAQWAGGQAWNQSGASDLWEMGQRIRKAKYMRRLVGTGGPLEGPAKKFVGGQKPDEKIKGVINKYEEGR